MKGNIKSLPCYYDEHLPSFLYALYVNSPSLSARIIFRPGVPEYIQSKLIEDWTQAHDRGDTRIKCAVIPEEPSFHVFCAPEQETFHSK